MGYGEVAGNESVHWTVVHEDEDTGAPKKLKLRQLPAGEAARHAGATEDEKELVNLGDAEVRGRDGIAFARIGRGRRRGAAGERVAQKDHPGCFRVRLRFLKRADAAQAAAAAVKSLEQVDGMWVLTLDVPAVARTAAQMNPEPNPPAEVRVDW